jgi:alkanesulfonate monooxygenase SsuD/methylene tetrahydromethanopterin reductase-like flavin-dependent oxidoreductase (luciferase family)
MRQAVDLYRRTFRPRAARPAARDAGLNVFAADTDDEARRLFSSLQQQFLALVRGTPGQLPPPVDDIDRPVGRERGGRISVARWPVRWSATRLRCAKASSVSSTTCVPTN